MSFPLVTVVYLCYNHKPFIEESLASVFAQTYPAIELIVVDDASTDGSVQVITNYLAEKPGIRLIFHTKNTGNCSAFNEALRISTGKYVIDLAADDVLLPDRLMRQVTFFESLSMDYGIVFSDSWLMDEKGDRISTFYHRDDKGNLLEPVPQGDVYEVILKKQFISAPTMLMKRTVLEELGGYDEQLSYEDFDFWVRSSRKWKYGFQDEILTAKRIVKGSHSDGFYLHRGNRHLASTLVVCHKALDINRSSKENLALARTVRYHARLAWFTNNTNISIDFLALLMLLRPLSFSEKLIGFAARRGFLVGRLYRWFSMARKKYRQIWRYFK